MNDLTPEEKKEAKKHLALAEGSFTLVHTLDEINESLKKIVEKEIKIPDFPSPPETIKAEILGAEVVSIKGEQGERGEKGEQGDRGEVGEKGEKGIKGDKGERGDDGVDGEKGEKGEQGERGEKGKDGSPDTGEQIIDKINDDDSEKKIKREKVEGLDDEFKNVNERISNIPRGGGRSFGGMKMHDLSSSTDGSTKIFSTPKNVGGFFICSDFPTVLIERNGFTFNATRTQATLTTDNAPSQGSQLLFVYAAMFN